MAERETGMFRREDVAAQDRHRPDQAPEPDEPTEAKPAKKRERQDQLNVLIRRGNAKRFKLKAWEQDTTMSDLIDQWVAEYLAGKR